MNWDMSHGGEARLCRKHDVLVHCLAGRRRRLHFIQFNTFNQINNFCISQGSAVKFATSQSQLQFVLLCNNANNKKYIVVGLLFMISHSKVATTDR